MKTILFLNNNFIDSLHELKTLLSGVMSENLRREVIAAFQDGIIDDWLSEGDEECNLILSELSKVNKYDSNQTIENRLSSIFTNDDKKQKYANHVVKFADHCQIHEVKYCKIGKNGNLIGDPITVSSAGIKFKRDEHIGFQLYAGIKISNPDNENLSIQFEVKDAKELIFSEQYAVSLNTKKNDIKYIPITFNLNTKNTRNLRLILKVNNEIIWSIPLFIGTPFIMLHLDDIRIPLSLVEGKEGIESFYMMRYPATEDFKFNVPPQVSVSYKDVNRIIKSLNNKYNTKFRLPSVTEWQYAAKEGIYNSPYRFAGSDNLDEVAWCNSRCDWYNKQNNIGLKKANKLGLYDMSGNVWEMTNDVVGSYRIICGGAYNSSIEDCEVLSTSKIGSANDSNYYCGFRLVCDVSSIDNLPDNYVEYEQTEEEHNCNSENQNFVDMGLSVLWSIENFIHPRPLQLAGAEKYAKTRGVKSRLPSADEFNELFKNCICEERNGYLKLTSKINGNYLKFPLGSNYFWTSTIDNTTYGDNYKWYIIASVLEQKCHNYGSTPSRGIGRSDRNNHVIAVMEQ